ncbi:hypothetical protein V8D89_001278 [Ganoderma adspersum]
MQAGITRDEALKKEEETFSTRAPWNIVGDDEKARLGTNNLRQYLLKVHGQAISDKLPGYRREVDKQLYETQEELAKLPTPTNPVVEIVSMISAFSLELKINLKGAPEGPDNSCVINLDDVMKKMNEFRGRELPNHLPNGVAKEYIKDIISKWSAPAKALFDQYSRVLDGGLSGLVDIHFQQYPSLQKRVRSITTDFLKGLEAITRACINDLLEMEKILQTTNEGRYYEACDAYEKDAPTSTATSSFDLHAAANAGVSLKSSASQSSTNGGSQTSSTLASCQASVNLGISVHTKEEKVKHARLNSALNIIASVSAYFDVTHERFTDNIRNAIDFYFVFGLIRNQALEKALHKELGIGSEDARERCAEYLQESPKIAEDRETLTRRLERLKRAKDVFTEAGI